MTARLTAALVAFAHLASPTFACDAVATPITSLDYASRYADDDPFRATLDPDRSAEVDAALAPLDGFIEDLAGRTAALYAGPTDDRVFAANCIMDALGKWAGADALSDLRTDTVRLTIGSRLAALALIAWQTRPYAPDHPARPAVLVWLGARMSEQISFWETAPDGARRGNLRAWAGLSAAALSVQTADERLSQWAARSVEDVACTAAPDGSIPQEMSRGRLALHYQLHAVAPLVVATVLLLRDGADIQCVDGVRRAARFALTDLRDGRQTAELTGEAQSMFDGGDRLQFFQLAWIEPFLLIDRSEAAKALADGLDDLAYSKLGGNQTALWGR